MMPAMPRLASSALLAVAAGALSCAGARQDQAEAPIVEVAPAVDEPEPEESPVRARGPEVFATLEQRDIVVHRLETLPAMPVIPGISPEEIRVLLEQLVQQGLPLPGLESLRLFHGWLSAEEALVVDHDTRTSIIALLRDADRFHEPREPCVDADAALSLRADDAAPLDIVVSFGCGRVEPHGFEWPYAHAGLTGEAAERLRQIYRQLFGREPSATGSGAAQPAP
jgi:hypothetical protein